MKKMKKIYLMKQIKDEKMRSLIHRIAKRLRKWYFVSVVMLLAMYTLDYVTPGIGCTNSTPSSVALNAILSFWVGYLFLKLMTLVVNKTYPEYLSLIGSNKLLNELLKAATAKAKREE